jgi:hypothetical protein
MRFLTLVGSVALGAVLSGQEGATTLPANYKVQFENAWVKVTAVRYEPFQKLPGHTHTPNPSAYVYLNDGPPVKFSHIGGHNVVATRPATRAGAFRVYQGLEEVHAVENTGDTASEFLRVELKTLALEPKAFRGKFERPAAASQQSVVHIDHTQVRISRHWVQPGQALPVSTAAEPSLLIALAAGSEFRPGQEKWIPPANTVRVHNTSATPIDFLQFEFKTRPVTSEVAGSAVQPNERWSCSDELW